MFNRMVSLSFFYRFCILSLGFLSATAVAGQKLALVYFQSETNLPFTLTWNNQTYTSDPKGVLEIKDVPEGEQSFQIDLGKDHGTASRFELNLGEDSRAFAIRQLLDNRIQLFNLVTYGLTTGISMPQIKQVLVYQNPLTGYSTNSEKNRTGLDNNESQKKDASPKTTLVQSAVRPEIATLPIPTAVKKVFDQTGSDGIDQIYLLSGEGKTDTVALFIPVLKTPASKPVVRPGSNEGSVPAKQKSLLPADGKNQPVPKPHPFY
jgi:hypothetical protein